MKIGMSVFVWMYPVVLISQSMNALEIAEKAQDAIRVKGLEAVATMKIMDDKGNERVRKISQISRLTNDGQNEKRLIRFLEPADVKGTGLLTYDYKTGDDDIWLYMPALRKTRRIVSSDKAKNFMGSEFSYADMTPPSLEDFDYHLMGEETVNGVACYKLDWIPRDDDIAEENGYSKRIVFIGQSDFVIRKSVYYDLDGELVKELNVLEVKEVDTADHRYRAVHLEMLNKQNGRKSVLINEKMIFNPSISEDRFTTRYLERE